MISTSSVSAQTQRPQGTDICFEEVGEVVDHCDALLKQASRIINEQNKQTKLQDMLIQDMLNDQRDLLKRAKEAEEAKTSWFRNPIYMLTLGVVAGGTAAILLDRSR